MDIEDAVFTFVPFLSSSFVEECVNTHSVSSAGLHVVDNAVVL